MKVFLVGSTAYETDRTKNVLLLQAMFEDLELVEAIYPGKERVPFQEKIIRLSEHRTGHALTAGELGCLLSHRKIWSEIHSSECNEEEGYLIIESDSTITDIQFLKEKFSAIHTQYDLFFWGAFDGRMQLKRSTSILLSKSISIGTPLIPSLYCTYGYSINKKAAGFLLKATGKAGYPCDHWKRRLTKAVLRIGGIKPCIITTDQQFESKIQQKKKYPLFYLVRDKIIDLKNKVISLVS